MLSSIRRTLSLVSNTTGVQGEQQTLHIKDIEALEVLIENCLRRVEVLNEAKIHADSRSVDCRP